MCIRDRFDLQVSAAALRKIIRKGKDLFLGKIGMVAQHRNEVVNDFLAVYGIVDDHPPVRVDDIVAGIALKSRAVQQPQQDVYKRQVLYCVALAMGSVLGAVILSLLKKNRTDAE